MLAPRSRVVVALLGAVALAALAAATPTHFLCSFGAGDAFELRVYLSNSPRFVSFNQTDALVWHERGLRYESAQPERLQTAEVAISEHLLANGSLFAHMYVTKEGHSPDPTVASYDRWSTSMLTKSLIQYGARLQPLGLKKLLTGEPAPWEAELVRGAEEARRQGRPEGEFISYWKPALHVQLVIDAEPVAIELMPPLYYNYLSGHRLISGNRYRPLVYVNELTVMKNHWRAINGSSGAKLPLELSFRPLPARRFQWMVNLEHSMKMNEEQLGISEKESEDLRGMFVNTNPVLLYTTVAVSAVHLLFDMLAFKNDMQFWSNVDTMEGLSSRTLIINQVMEVVIFFYLVEEDASWLIKITSIFTLVLGAFKVFKSLQVKKRDVARSGGEESLTDRYDRVAFTYLLPPLLLTVVLYSVYSLVTSYHRSWYSWLLESLVALVYGCGFIVMTPQLFINYRLKSVAHLPWKFFMYKALNTFIDDLFAFIIKMPTMHRMSCFRDDIVFAVFLYQRWIYKVDMKRMNEFGQRGEGEGEAPEGVTEGKTQIEGAAAAPADAKGARRTAATRKMKKTN